MTGEELPGRPGNLTPEQEEKLREIWIATLQVFGVLDSHRAKEANGSGQVTPLIGAHPASDTTTSEKPKKNAKKPKKPKKPEATSSRARGAKRKNA